MFKLSKNIVSVPSRIISTSAYRSIYSGKIPLNLSKSSFSDTGSEGSKKVGYGEKEICLLGPIDIRTPLPGNTGIPPVSMLYTEKIRDLPLPAGEKCDMIQSLLPEERHYNLLVQAVCVAAESILSSSNKIECIAYNCPELLKKDFLDLFPHRDIFCENLTVITFCHQTENDMSAWSENGEAERKELESCFVMFANTICSYLKHYHYWADFIHPNSGKPHLSPLTSATMFETDKRYRNFGFNIEDLGCCKIISHPEWGTKMFSGAIFTNAKMGSQELKEVLRKNKDGLNESSEK